MFKDAKVGDELYSIEDGWGILEAIADMGYPLNVQFKHHRVSFTIDGRRFTSSKNPTLFWDEIEFEIPKKPLPNLKVDTPVLVWSISKDRKEKAHFKKFDVNGRIVCFLGGTTSWSNDGVCGGWEHWELAEDIKYVKE